MSTVNCPLSTDFYGIVKNLKFLGADGQVLTAGKSGKVPPGQISGSGNVAEPFRYFYHPDHLGSTSYVTDASGEVFQHMEYFAFGETFVEEHSNTDKTPYLFNGKELDEETGLYYYGARYYDARVSVWQSVDPLADKILGWSPYNYTFDNPLNLVDPNGKKPGEPPGTHFLYLESGVAVGLGYGGVLMQNEGIAWDAAGKTHFTTRTATFTGFDKGRGIEDVAIGAEATLASVGYKYDKRSSFLATLDGSAVNSSGPGIKGKLGLGVEFNENVKGVNLGLGVGVSVSLANDNVIQSISLSDNEANKVSDATDVWSETWEVNQDNIQPITKGNEIVGYSSTVMTKDTKGRRIDTGIKIMTIDKNRAVWYSEAYKKKVDELNK